MAWLHHVYYLKCSMEVFMHYTYVEAWSVLGVILPEDIQSYEINNSKGCRFILTRDPDALLTITDRRVAISNFILGAGGLSQLDSDDLAFSSAIENIQSERRNIIKGQAVLIVEAQGNIEVSLKEPYKEFDEFIVAFEAIDEDDVEKIIKIHQSDIEAMKVALALEYETPLRFYKLSSGVYYTNVGNKIIYNIKLSFCGSGFSSEILTSDGVGRISDQYKLLREAKNMKKVMRLFSLMTDHNISPLLSFISGWTAMEIMINELFSIHKKELINEEESLVRKEFEKRKNKNKRGPVEYTLMDKFILSALKLFPRNIDDDCEIFSELNKLRNSIHYKEFSEANLPLSKIATLIKRYMQAHTKR